mmetsp:Transcript_59520/g.121941  ORF Transcript_59520/g.121941 Transcript_59520/m.121941 type:complete len:106 (+) Transcript_59520:587-904(+)
MSEEEEEASGWAWALPWVVEGPCQPVLLGPVEDALSSRKGHAARAKTLQQDHDGGSDGTDSPQGRLRRCAAAPGAGVGKKCAAPVGGVRSASPASSGTAHQPFLG